MTLTPHPNPLRIMQRRTRRLWIVAIPALAATATWALRSADPESIIPPPVNRPSQESVAEREAPAAIDRSVFAVNLWNAPAQPDETSQTVAQAPPPAPLNLSLIGIINEDGVSKAALYDADADRLLIVADGDSIRDHVVRIVVGPQSVVELSNGSATKRLVLRPDKEAPES